MSYRSQSRSWDAVLCSFIARFQPPPEMAADGLVAADTSASPLSSDFRLHFSGQQSLARMTCAVDFPFQAHLFDLQQAAYCSWINLNHGRPFVPYCDDNAAESGNDFHFIISKPLLQPKYYEANSCQFTRWSDNVATEKAPSPQ